MTLKQKFLHLFVRYVLVAVVCVMPVLSPFTGTALGAPGVTIPDDNLRAVLELALGEGEGAPITEAELARIPTFKASNKSITDLTGLEFCTNLKTLGLEHNTISDVSTLAELTNLKTLYLTNTNLSDISALEGLNKLQELFLMGNELNSDAYTIHIPALEANGTDVRYDEEKPWDVTSDGVVNIFDLILVAAHFGE